MPTMESQSDERDHPGAVEHAVDVPAAAVGDLRTGSDTAGDGDERCNRVESRHPRQGATAGVHHAGLPTDVT